MIVSVVPYWGCEITLGNFNGNCPEKSWPKSSNRPEFRRKLCYFNEISISPRTFKIL